MSVHRSVTATLFVAIISALLFVALAYSPAGSKADAQTGKADRAAKADSVTKADLTAKAAKATPTGRAARCGFSFWRQTWRNCQNHGYRIAGAWYEASTNETGEFIKCVRPGTTYLSKVVPFGTVAITAGSIKGGGRC